MCNVQHTPKEIQAHNETNHYNQEPVETEYTDSRRFPIL